MVVVWGFLRVHTLRRNSVPRGTPAISPVDDAHRFRGDGWRDDDRDRANGAVKKNR